MVLMYIPKCSPFGMLSNGRFYLVMHAFVYELVEVYPNSPATVSKRCCIIVKVAVVASVVARSIQPLDSSRAPWQFFLIFLIDFLTQEFFFVYIHIPIQGVISFFIMIFLIIFLNTENFYGTIAHTMLFQMIYIKKNCSKEAIFMKLFAK